MPAQLRHKLRNIFQSILLILGMALIVSACAWTVWGPGAAVWALIGLSLSILVSPTISPRVILSLYRAQPLRRTDAPNLYTVLDELSRRANLPTSPQLYYLPSGMMNAIAVGNKASAAIAVTDGMIRSLRFDEIAGVLAHEVSHIANNDLWIMNLADSMSRATSLFSYFGIFLLFLNLPLVALGGTPTPWLLILLFTFAPSVMSILQFALSRAREFDADLDAARLLGGP